MPDTAKGYVSNMRAIGGEFEIDPHLFSDFSACDCDGSKDLFSSGRAALSAILGNVHNSLGTDVLYVPEYLCGSIVRTVEQAGFQCVSYALDSRLHLKRTSFLWTSADTSRGCVLLINYYGCLNLQSDIAWLKSRFKMPVILDNVQAYFQSQNVTGADYSFTSFRKTFPVTDGATVISSNGQVLMPSKPAVYGDYKALGGVIKWIAGSTQVPDAAYLSFLVEGERILGQEDRGTGISRIGYHLYRKVDEKQTAALRIRNYRYVTERLEQMGVAVYLRPESDDLVPLFLPLLLANRDAVRQALLDARIYLPIHWPDSTDSEFSCFLKRHALSVVIDQRYSLEDMERLCSLLKRLHPKAIHYAG